MKSERQAGDGFQALQTLFNLNLQLLASLRETAKRLRIRGGGTNMGGDHRWKFRDALPPHDALSNLRPSRYENYWSLRYSL
jgi:hypothetical protein